MSGVPLPRTMADEDRADLERLVALLRGVVQKHVADFEGQPTGKALLRAQMRLHRSLGEATAMHTRLDQHPVHVPVEEPKAPEVAHG